MRQGVNRPELEEILREFVVRVTGIDPLNVFFSDYASDVNAPAPNDAFVSITIGAMRDAVTHATRMMLDSLEYHRLTVTAGGPTTISLNIRGQVFTIAEASSSAHQVRETLLAALNSDEFVATAAGSHSIDIESRLIGVRLLPTVVEGPCSIVQYRGNKISIGQRDVTLQLQMRCWGPYSATPDASNNGVDIAERIVSAMMMPEEMSDVRFKGYAITNARCGDQRFVDGSEMRMIGEIDADITTVLTHVVSITDATQASLVVQERT